MRTDGKQTLLALFNFSDRDAVIAPELNGEATMLLNTDWEPFGGKTKWEKCKSISNSIPAFCGILYRSGIPLDVSRKNER